MYINNRTLIETKMGIRKTEAYTIFNSECHSVGLRLIVEYINSNNIFVSQKYSYFFHSNVQGLNL
jgi:hypothetical protein